MRELKISQKFKISKILMIVAIILCIAPAFFSYMPKFLNACIMGTIAGVISYALMFSFTLYSRFGQPISITDLSRNVTYEVIGQVVYNSMAYSKILIVVRNPDGYTQIVRAGVIPPKMERFTLSDVIGKNENGNRVGEVLLIAEIKNGECKLIPINI